MKTTRIFTFLCLLATAGLVVLLVQERQGRLKLEQANQALQQHLRRLGEAIAENQQPTAPVPQVMGSPSQLKGREAPSAPDDQSRELLRLRGEVGTLLRQSNELASLREDTRQVRAAWESKLKEDASQAMKSGAGTSGNGSQLEILSAAYGTASTNLDVAAELNDRIRGDTLKAVASNNIKGDPEFGQVKNLTVIYRFAGVTRTNEYQEGDVVILPSQ